MEIAACRDNEYFAEANAIASDLNTCASEKDAIDLVYRVFCRFFTTPRVVGPRDKYQSVGQHVWQLGQLYRGAFSPPETEAMVSLRRRAASGGPDEWLEFGVALCNGDGMRRDIALGQSYIEKAASAGCLNAQMTLGRMHEDGFLDGGLSKAKEWYEKAAEQNDADAQYLLGYIYTRSGFGPDPNQAAQWMTKAAAQGHAAAQRDLGVMYYRGDGVKQDQKKSREWLQKSASQGNDQAKKLLGSLDYSAAQKPWWKFWG